MSQPNSIHYRIRCERRWSEADRRRLAAHSQTWEDRLSILALGYDVRDIARESDFQSSTELAPSPRAASDYVTVVQALRELEQLFPEARASISDDFGINESVRPSDIDLVSLRQAMLEQWGDDDGSYEQEPESDDPDEELERVAHYLRHLDDDEEDVDVHRLLRAARLDMGRATAGNLLANAAKDFEIWKQAQRKKRGPIS